MNLKKKKNLNNQSTYPWIHNEFVHSSGSKSGSDSVHDGLTSIDVGDDLLLATGSLGSVLQK